MTSNEIKAFLILEKCDDQLIQRLMKKLENNGSVKAKGMLQKLQKYVI
ncbi:hypothetical protein SAMN04487943_101575 [Gracilibacillus orientalis]|uniref:Uncharacterized protein n=1 Tax=Gracilibacillus orientalis TaxID=334253 RepID=A0A1I4HQ30_9BACI|nr:hypothetical protein SAMN04487943_101575 [Gracilibacillus orientalis]